MTPDDAGFDKTTGEPVILSPAGTVPLDVDVVGADPAVVAGQLGDFSAGRWRIDRPPPRYLEQGAAWRPFRIVQGRTLPAGDVIVGGRRLVTLGGDYWRDLPFEIGAVDWFFVSDWERADGSMSSLPATIVQPYITFLVGGGVQSESVGTEERLRVELWLRHGDLLEQYVNPEDVLARGGGPIVEPAPVGERLEDIDGMPTQVFADGVYIRRQYVLAPGTDVLRRENFDVRPWHNQVCRLRVVDETVGGHITLADARWTSERAPAAGAIPVWGVADTHAHPMAAKAHGGGVIAGDYAASSTTALDLRPCDQGPNQPHWRDVGDIVINMFPDGHQAGRRDGAPMFAGWPGFREGIHQQMHPEWIRRARDGGLRLMVALAVNNETLAAHHDVGNALPHDDGSSSERQLRYWRDVCANHADVMEVAETPSSARRIIASGRVAIVLGLEVDKALGRWATVDELVREATAQHGDSSDESIRSIVRRQLEQLWGLGVRQLNPVHLMDNAFGNYAIYDDSFNVSQHHVRGDYCSVVGADDLDFRMDEDRDPIESFAQWLGEGYSPPDYHSVAPGVGHANGGPGLTRAGAIAIQEMVRLGFVIDVDHMSRRSAEQVMDMAAADRTLGPDRPYPVISAHASFRDLSPRRNWSDLDHPGPGQRRNHHYWPHESEKTAAQVARIRALGGFVAPITSHMDSLTVLDEAGSVIVPNDCAGTSKTFAQEFLHAVAHMRGGIAGGAVGLGTDMGLTRQLGPRFGPLSAYGLTDEHLASARLERHYQALAQDNGVRYDRPAATLPMLHEPAEVNAEWKLNPYVHPHDGWFDFRFGTPAHFGVNVWRALARWSGGDTADPDQDDERQVLRGLRARDEAEARRLGGRSLIAWQVANGRTVDDTGGADPRSDYRIIADAVAAWRRTSGRNAPLVRCRTGSRDWDYNTEGLAHYGLLPDLFQDLHNVGVPPSAMAALFQSAAAYLQVWERCAANNQIPLVDVGRTFEGLADTTSPRSDTVLQTEPKG